MFICSLLIGLGLIARAQRSSFHFQQELLPIHIVGAVNETEVKVPYGSTIDDVLSLLSLFPDASILDLPGNKKLTGPTTIVIPFSTGTTIYVTGCVTEPKVLLLPPNATASYILDQVTVKSNADIARFKRKRVFKNGAIILIPQKKTSHP